MKNLKKIGVVAAFIFASFGFTSLTANAAVIHQDVFIDIDFAEEGNVWEITEADSGLFGTLRYSPGLVEIGGIITPEDDPYFTFSFSLAGLAFSAMDDFDFGSFAPLATVDVLDFFSGVNSLDFLSVDPFILITPDGLDTVFVANDAQGSYVTGLLSFGEITLVSEPSMLILMLGGLVLVARRKFTA